MNHFNGKMPDQLKDLLHLPGIGRSTAGAILSFAFYKDASILDGNAKRVLSRLFAVSGTLGERKTEQFLWQISESLIPKGFSNPFNQALMDLGSLLCTPKEPQCSECPLCDLCKGRASGKPERYPSKRIKRTIPHVESVSGVIKKDGKVLLNQRPPSGLLGGLWEFPNWRIEEKQRSRLRLRLRKYIQQETKMNVEVKEFLGVLHHTYSHFKLTLNVFVCRHLNGDGKGKWVPIKNLRLLPMSRIDRRIAQAISNRGLKIPD